MMGLNFMAEVALEPPRELRTIPQDSRIVFVAAKLWPIACRIRQIQQQEEHIIMHMSIFRLSFHGIP